MIFRTDSTCSGDSCKAVSSYGPIKIPVDIIERHHTIRGADGKYSQLPKELMGMPRNYKGVTGYRARGGPVSANSPYVVGENGQELFIPNTGGYVVNATDTRRILSGGQYKPSDIATTTTNTFNSNFGGVTINTANVDLQDINRQTDWREKAKRSRMGTN